MGCLASDFVVLMMQRNLNLLHSVLLHKNNDNPLMVEPTSSCLTVKITAVIYIDLPIVLDIQGLVYDEVRMPSLYEGEHSPT